MFSRRGVILVSRKNINYKAQQNAKCVPHYGIRKLSIGVASVLLGTAFYMQNGTVHADVNPTVSTGNDSVNVVNKDSGISGSAGASSTLTGVGSVNSAGSMVSTGDVTNSTAPSQVLGSPVEGATKQANNSALAAGEPESTSSVGQVNVDTDNFNSISSLPPASHHQAAGGNQSNERLSDNLLLSVNQKLNVNNSSLLASKVALNGVSDQRFAELQQSLVQQDSNNESDDIVQNVHVSLISGDTGLTHQPGDPWTAGSDTIFDLNLDKMSVNQSVVLGHIHQDSDTGHYMSVAMSATRQRVMYHSQYIGYVTYQDSGWLSIPDTPYTFVLTNKPVGVSGLVHLSVNVPSAFSINQGDPDHFRGILLSHNVFSFVNNDGKVTSSIKYTIQQNDNFTRYDQESLSGIKSFLNSESCNHFSFADISGYGQASMIITFTFPELNLDDVANTLYGNNLTTPISLLNKDYLVAGRVHLGNGGTVLTRSSNVTVKADNGTYGITGLMSMGVDSNGRYVDSWDATAGHGYYNPDALLSSVVGPVGLSLQQMRSRIDLSKNIIMISQQKDGSLLYVANFTPSFFSTNPNASELSRTINGYKQLNADSNPDKAYNNSLHAMNDIFHNRLTQLDIWQPISIADPTVSDTLIVDTLDPDTGAIIGTNKSGFTPNTYVSKGQSTVKLHVISSVNGSDLQQVKSFTDLPDQNKHAQLDIPTIAGYQLAADPQNVLSKFHLNGEVITANSSVDYPAENTIADYYIVLAPKDENMTVNIVDDDENGKVLDSGTISGKFGDKVVETSDIQGKVKKLLDSGLYTLESNDLDNVLMFKDGSQTATVKLKHKLDSVQRHYRVIEDLPDGTKKVIIDMEATLYKDAARNYYEDYGAWTKDGKLLKRNEVKLLKQTNILDNPGSAMDWVNANIDSVLGYRHYIDRKSYPHYGDYYGGLGVWGDDSTVWMDLFKRVDPHDGVGFATNVFPSTDFHIVYAPKDEVATVNIVDADENNKVLSTGAVTGKFNTRIVTNNDVQAKLKSLLDTGHYVLQSNGFDQAAKYQDGTNTITIALKHKIDSTQRHYRVIEDLPNGTKKVIVDYQITFYKDAASKYYNRMGAVTVDTLKLLKPNSVQMSVGQYSFPNDNTSVYSAIDEVPGYSYQMIDGINFNSYPHGVNCRIWTNSQMAQFPPTTFNKADFKDLVIFDLFLGGSNNGGTDLVSNLQNIGCVENPLASRDFHITYSRRSYPVTVNYYDIDGKLVNSTTSMHKFGDTVPIVPVTPTNYVLVSGQVKTDYLTGLGLNEVDFLVEPKLTTTAETKTVSRTITVQTPDGQTNNVVQTVTFVRNSYLNQVTKQATYSPWSFGGQYQFSGYQPKPMAGYTANVVSSVIVTPDSLDTTVNVVYHKIPVVYEIDYKLANGTLVTKAQGVATGDGTIHLTAPQGYRLLTTVTDVQVGSSSRKLTVLVVPAEQIYTAYSTLPSSVTEPLTKTVTRTINITMPNGRVRRIVQQVHFVRTVTVVANGKVTYSNWTGVGQTSFDRLFVPKRRGYRLVMTDNQDQTLIGVNQMVVDPTMNNVVINVKYVK